MSDLLSLANLREPQLEWRQPALGRKFELNGAEGTYGRLELKKLDGSLGRGTTARAAFTFERQGLLKSHINVQFADSEQIFAVYEANFTGKKGQLRYASGPYLEFQTTNFFETEWQWLTPEGQGLIGFQKKQAGKPKAAVFLGDDAFDRVDLDLLLLLGFYLLLLAPTEATGQ